MVDSVVDSELVVVGVCVMVVVSVTVFVSVTVVVGTRIEVSVMVVVAGVGFTFIVVVNLAGWVCILMLVDAASVTLVGTTSIIVLVRAEM